jgi:hypothetical protein
MNSVLIFWVVTPCGLVGGYQCFGGTYFLCLQGSNLILYIYIYMLINYKFSFKLLFVLFRQ